jgi:hypothetical protein
MRSLGTTAAVVLASWVMLALCVLWAAVQG